MGVGLIVELVGVGLVGVGLVGVGLVGVGLVGGKHGSRDRPRQEAAGPIDSDDIATVPSRRTRDAEDVDITWKLSEHTLSLPCLACAMDGVVDARLAVAMGKLGGLAVLNLEGVQTRYENADEVLAASVVPQRHVDSPMQELYLEPVGELVARRIEEIKRRRARRRVAHAAARRGYYAIALEPASTCSSSGHRRLGRARERDGRAADLRKFIPDATCR